MLVVDRGCYMLLLIMCGCCLMLRFVIVLFCLHGVVVCVCCFVIVRWCSSLCVFVGIGCCGSSLWLCVVVWRLFLFGFRLMMLVVVCCCYLLFVVVRCLWFVVVACCCLAAWVVCFRSVVVACCCCVLL